MEEFKKTKTFACPLCHHLHKDDKVQAFAMHILTLGELIVCPACYDTIYDDIEPHFKKRHLTKEILDGET